MDEATRSPAAPGPLAAFARFVLCGGGVGVASSPAVALLAALMPWAVANALITIASTILCTELHARFTFGSGQRAGWRQHWQSAGSATAAYAVTCAAMFILHAVQPSPGMLREQAVYLSASALAGIGRFLVLRLFVFTGDRTRPTAAGAQQSGTTRMTTVRADARSWTVNRPSANSRRRISSGKPILGTDTCRAAAMSRTSGGRRALSRITTRNLATRNLATRRPATRRPRSTPTRVRPEQTRTEQTRTEQST
jgi:putative flippase GtrA